MNAAEEKETRKGKTSEPDPEQKPSEEESEERQSEEEDETTAPPDHIPSGVGVSPAPGLAG